MKKLILIFLSVIMLTSTALAASTLLRHVDAGKVIGIVALQNQSSVVFIDNGENVKVVAIDQITSYTLGYIPRGEMIVEACGLSAWAGLSDPAEIYEIQLPQPAASCSSGFVYIPIVVNTR